jgi:hypothetical protein
MTSDRYGLQVNNAELVGQIADIDSRFPNVRVLSYSTYDMAEEQDGGGEGDGGAVRGGGVSRSAGGGQLQEITCVRISGTSWAEQQDVVEQLLAQVSDV